MSTLRQSERIEFNGRTSDEFGIYSVNVNSGLLSEPSWGNRSIVETKVKNRDIPFFHSVQSEPLSFPLYLAFEDNFDSDSLAEVYDWLHSDFYSILRFSARPDIIYYAIVVDQPNLVHNAAESGYIEVNMRCNAPYAFSDVLSDSYDLSSNVVAGYNATVYNRGKLPIYLDLDVTMVGDGDFSVSNYSNGGQTISFTGLSDTENVTFDSQNEIIETSGVGYRYDNWNKVNLVLVPGKNILNIKGNVQIKLIYQYKMLTGSG
jgi:phage-related protein